MGALTHNGEVLQSLPANASQINFDKTGTNLNSTQVENAIKEVNTKVNTNTNDIAQLRSGLTNLTSANGGDAVDITDRVGSANAYLVPANGYITLDTGASSSGGIDIRITGANGYGLAYIIISAVTSNVVQSVYVRKGMYAYITSNTTGSSTVKFRPFT